MSLLTFIKAYQEPHRHYHTLAHIEDCLREFAEIKHLVADPFEMWLAIWFHDAVYSVGADASLNEQLSAEEALRWMPAEVSQAKVVDLIMVTKHSKRFAPTSLDEQFMCDIDLAALGAPPEHFDRNSANVRKEYEQYPDMVYIPERIKILTSFNEREHIYYTDHFRAKYEEQARQNLTAEITRLCNSKI